MSTENEYSFNSIKTEIDETRESAIFFSPLDEKFTEINLDTALREQVSENTANISKHEAFISENSDLKNLVEGLEIKIEEFDNFNYVIHEDFDGNIINRDSIDSLEKIVNDIRQIVYQLVRDYGTHLNTGDLKYQNQLATETLEELNQLITDNKENLLPIRDVINEVKDSRVSFFVGDVRPSLRERLIIDFKHISDKLKELSEFEEIRDIINTLQEQINDIIENGVRQDIIDDIYLEIEKIKEDIEWLKENGGGGTGPKPEADLPDAGIIQQCLNVFLITNTTLFRMRGIVEENEDLIDYIVFQISQGYLTFDKIKECYPYLEKAIEDRLINKYITNYKLNKERLAAQTATELIETFSDEIAEETDTEKLNRLIQVALNVFIKTNSTAVRTKSVLDEEHNLVEYIVAQIIAGRMDRVEICKEYPHLEEEIFNRLIELGQGW